VDGLYTQTDVSSGAEVLAGVRVLGVFPSGSEVISDAESRDDSLFGLREPVQTANYRCMRRMRWNGTPSTAGSPDRQQSDQRVLSTKEGHPEG
jgi:hypothetical protein